MSRQKAFTLIELMIVVAIIGILAAIAYPSYMQQMIKTRRATASACLVELAQYMERYYTTSMSYTGAAVPATSCQTNLASYYDFSFKVAVTATTFSLQAVPAGAQAGDARCGTLGIDHLGNRTITGTGTVAECW